MLHINLACPKLGHRQYDPAKHRDMYKGNCPVCRGLYDLHLQAERLRREIEAHHARTHT